MTSPNAMPSAPSLVSCHICGAPAARLVSGYEQFRRVTSDCKPWPSGGQLAVCQACGCLQNVIDAAWRADVEAIYASYLIYHQSDGAEQPVFDAVSGQPMARSARVLRRLLTE